MADECWRQPTLIVDEIHAVVATNGPTALSIERLEQPVRSNHETISNQQSAISNRLVRIGFPLLNVQSKKLLASWLAFCEHLTSRRPNWRSPDWPQAFDLQSSCRIHPFAVTVLTGGNVVYDRLAELIRQHSTTLPAKHRRIAMLSTSWRKIGDETSPHIMAVPVREQRLVAEHHQSRRTQRCSSPQHH